MSRVVDVWFAILKTFFRRFLVSMQVRGRCKVMFPDYCARILRQTGGLPVIFRIGRFRKREFHWALVADGEHVSMLCDEHSAQLMETVRNALRSVVTRFLVSGNCFLFLEHDTCVYGDEFCHVQ